MLRQQLSLPPAHLPGTQQVNSAGGEAALSAQTGNVEVGAPYQVGRPSVAANTAVAGVSTLSCCHPFRRHCTSFGGVIVPPA